MLFIRFAVSDQRCCAPLSPTRAGQWWPSLGAWPLSRTPLAHTYRQEEAAVESRSACAEPALSPVDDSLDDIDPGVAAMTRGGPCPVAAHDDPANGGSTGGREGGLRLLAAFEGGRVSPLLSPRCGSHLSGVQRGPTDLATTSSENHPC